MLDEIINNPDLDKYVIEFEAGHIVFLEGDDSQDLYILISGQVDVIKGTKKITEIYEAGALFGEMSFLLEAGRTATVKAKSDVKAICIPKEEVTTFLNKFPKVAWGLSPTVMVPTWASTRELAPFCRPAVPCVILRPSRPVTRLIRRWR